MQDHIHPFHPHHEPPVQDYVVKILKSEIKFDVRFDSTIRERIVNREAHNASKKNTKNKYNKVGYAIPDETEVEDWLVRQIETAIDNVHGELNWCCVEWNRFVDDELYELPEEWAIHFHFSRMWAGSIKGLRTKIHKYITEYILWQWYRAAMPNGSNVYKAEAEEWLQKAYQEARSERVQLEPFRL